MAGLANAGMLSRVICLEPCESGQREHVDFVKGDVFSILGQGDVSVETDDVLTTV